MYGYRTFLNAALSCSGTKHFFVFFLLPKEITATKNGHIILVQKMSSPLCPTTTFDPTVHTHPHGGGRETDEELSLLCNDKTL